jgi:hypothetical protein
VPSNWKRETMHNVPPPPFQVFHVGFRWVRTPIVTEALEPTFTEIGNWVRFNGLSWFVSTHWTALQVYERLRRHLHNEDSILIIAVNPETAQGWAPQFMWDYFNSKAALLRSPPPLGFRDLLP